MTTYFVSRHNGAVDWAARRGITATLVAHLEPASVRNGDIVVGTLPVNLVAEVNARGARYIHLALDLPVAVRGAELTADDMDRYGAELVEYRAERVGPLG